MLKIIYLFESVVLSLDQRLLFVVVVVVVVVALLFYVGSVLYVQKNKTKLESDSLFDRRLPTPIFVAILLRKLTWVPSITDFFSRSRNYVQKRHSLNCVTMT